MIYDLLILPFANHDVMRRALVACIAISFSSAPLGVFMVLRRMSLAGDVLSHGLLPGVAVAYIIFGTSFWPMTIGGVAAGLAVTIASVLVTRLTKLKEDASFAAAYMISLAAGVLIITSHGGDEELIHTLFGQLSAITPQLLVFAVCAAIISIIGLAAIYRPLIVECFDPVFMRSVRGKGGFYHQLFLILIVLNLVSAFQALGTLMALGLMIMPAICARFWASKVDTAIFASVGFALISSISGLLFSYHTKLEPGPSIVIAGGILYVFSVIFGSHTGIIRKFLPHHHLEE